MDSSDVSRAVVRDAEGNSDLFGGIVRNLDKTEADINEELRIISDSSSDGIFKASMTKGFPVLYANEGYYKMHGYTKQQMFKRARKNTRLDMWEFDIHNKKIIQTEAS